MQTSYVFKERERKSVISCMIYLNEMKVLLTESHAITNKSEIVMFKITVAQLDSINVSTSETMMFKISVPQPVTLQMTEKNSSYHQFIQQLITSVVDRY